MAALGFVSCTVIRVFPSKKKKELHNSILSMHLVVRKSVHKSGVHEVTNVY